MGPYEGPFKTRVVVEAIAGHKTINEIAETYGIHPSQVGKWKVEALARLPEAQVLVEAYRRQYNPHRPHSSLGYATPAAFAAACLAAAPASAGPAPSPNRTETVDNPLLTTGT